MREAEGEARGGLARARVARHRGAQLRDRADGGVEAGQSAVVQLAGLERRDAEQLRQLELGGGAHRLLLRIVLVAHVAIAVLGATVQSQSLESLARAFAGAKVAGGELVNLRGAELADVRQALQPLERVLPAAAQLLLEAPRAAKDGGGGLGVRQCLVIRLLEVLVRVVVSLDGDLQLLEVPKLCRHLVLDVLAVR